MEVAGPNFMTAIEAHIKWKSRPEACTQGCNTATACALGEQALVLLAKPYVRLSAGT